MPPGADYTAPAGLTATAPTVRAIPPPSTSSSTPSPARVTSGAIPSGAITSGAITSGAITSGAVTYGARSSPGSYVGGRASTRALLVSAKFGAWGFPGWGVRDLSNNVRWGRHTELWESLWSVLHLLLVIIFVWSGVQCCAPRAFAGTADVSKC